MPPEEDARRPDALVSPVDSEGALAHGARTLCNEKSIFCHEASTGRRGSRASASGDGAENSAVRRRSGRKASKPLSPLALTNARITVTATMSALHQRPTTSRGNEEILTAIATSRIGKGDILERLGSISQGFGKAHVEINLTRRRYGAIRVRRLTI